VKDSGRLLEAHNSASERTRFDQSCYLRGDETFDLEIMTVGLGCMTAFVLLLTVTMVTTLRSSWLGVTAPAVSTATNLSSSVSALRGGSSGTYHHHQKHKGNVTIGLILPHTNFGVRDYIRAIKGAVEKLQKSRGHKLTFLKKYGFTPSEVHSVMMTLTPSPTGKYTMRFSLHSCTLQD
jgi:hypothetical protein